VIYKRHFYSKAKRDMRQVVMLLCKNYFVFETNKYMVMSPDQKKLQYKD